MRYPIINKFIQLLDKDLYSRIQSVYLFGSRARGEARPDSDYDLLVIVNEDFSLADKDRIYDHVMDILLQTGHVLSLKIFKGAEFRRLSGLRTTFTQNVLRERVKVG